MYPDNTATPEGEVMSKEPSLAQKSLSTVTSAVQMLKVNVLVNTLCGKYWGPDLEAVKLRLDANNSFARGNLQGAVDIYTKAVNLGKY